MAGKGKGGKKQRRGKGGNKDEGTKRELRIKEEGEEYGEIEKTLGNCRLMVKCSDLIKRNCIIRGKFRKRVWMKAGDVILIEKDQ